MVSEDSLNIAQRKMTNIIIAMQAPIRLFLSLLILSNLKVYAQQIIKEERKIILIDPGHGGVDSGTVSADGLQEKDVVLDIARSMIAWNKGLLKSKYDIYVTRNTDTLISLDDRTKLTGYMKPDILISLHCNHSVSSKANGIEIYTYKVINGYTEQSVRHAQTMADQLNQKLGFKNRGTKKADFQVLRETIWFCPAILLELGYLSNTVDLDYLKNKEKRKALALAILMAF